MINEKLLHIVITASVKSYQKSQPVFHRIIIIIILLDYDLATLFLPLLQKCDLATCSKINLLRLHQRPVVGRNLLLL